MDPVTHLATGLIVSQLIPGPSRWWSALAGAIFAVLPDCDYVLAFWDRMTYIRYHRGFTHSIFALPLFALAVAGLGQALGGARWFRPLFFMGVAVIATHLFLDLATSYGTQLFNPLSHRRLTLDWLFIIDPYLTALLLLGAALALFFPLWGRKAGACCLAAGCLYMLLCGLYHQQALNLARQLRLTGNNPERTVAALPQPFSCRRWLLLASGPQEIEQAFVELPYGAWWGRSVGRPPAPADPPAANAAHPGAASLYQPPEYLASRTWTAAPAPGPDFAPDTRAVLDIFLEFARFPLLQRVQPLEGGAYLLEWRDLRFSVPGRDIPFVLQLRMDAQGRLQSSSLGRRRG
jgi:inner membrane protein